jgi:GNAT superfamily N-acetyltransferase
VTFDGSQWSREAILAEARDWVWVPPDAYEDVTAAFRLTHYPERSSVQWSNADGPVVALVDEVERLARRAARPVLRWWVDDATRPTDTETVLRGRGYEHVESVDVLARTIGPANLPDPAVPPAVVVAPVESAETLDAAVAIDAEVFEWAPMTAAQRAHELSLIDDGLRTGRWEVRRWVAMLDGSPVGTAGLTLPGKVARLWGGGVVARARGNGVYRALLDARLRWAVTQGATLAMVKGRVATSAPILRRAGFASYGEQRCYQRALPAPRCE